MVASTSHQADRAALAFESLAASDPRVCLLIDAAGVVISVNDAARRALPGLVPGIELASLSPTPDAIRSYLLQCTRTRGPLPGSLMLTAADGEPAIFKGHGGLAERSTEGETVVVLRLLHSEIVGTAFAALNHKIEALNAELDWRLRAGRTAGQLAAIVSSSTDAIFSETLDGIVTSWNQGAERMFGYTAEEMAGHSGTRLIPPEKRDEEAMILQRVRAGETLEPMETVRRTKEGRLLDVSVTISRIEDGTGAVIGVSKIERDISARKRDEQALRAGHATFRQLVENSPFGIFAIDADFRLAQVSAGAQRVFEHVRPLLGRDFAEALRIIWPEPAAAEFIGRFRHTLATGEPYREPSTVETRNDTGQVEAYDWKIERLTLPDGRPGVVCHFYDLSVRQRHEAELRASEHRFRGTFENVSVGMAHVGMDGSWLEINVRFCEILGYSRDEMMATTLDGIKHPDDRDSELDHKRKLLAGEISNYQLDRRYRRKDGSAVWCGVSVGMQRDDAGAPLYLIYVLRDISGRMEAQAQQQFLMRELVHRSKNQLAVVQSIAAQTARNAGSKDDFCDAFFQRLNGLAVSIDVLVKGNWASIPLDLLVRDQLSPFRSDEARLECTGPEVSISADAAEAIGLTMHELATNSVKYGAWSTAEGVVSVSWNLECRDPDLPHLHLRWVESGGPPVSEPSHKGFGHVVIEKMVAEQLHAKVDLAYLPEGVSWTLLLPSIHLIR